MSPPLVILCCSKMVPGFVVARSAPFDLSSLERSGPLDQRHRSAARQASGLSSLGWTQPMLRVDGLRKGGDRDHVLSRQGKVLTELKGYQRMDASRLERLSAEGTGRSRLRCASGGPRAQCSFRPSRALELPVLPC
jgi:hypothetical protein